MTLDRREFLHRTTAAALTLAMPGLIATAAPQQDPPVSQPIVDTHQHLWNLEKFQPPWLDSAPDVLKHSYTTREYLAATEGLGLAESVYMEVDVDPKQQTQEAEHVLELSKSDQHPTAGAVISGRPGSSGFLPYFKP